MTVLLQPSEGSQVVSLPAEAGLEASTHILDRRSALALNAALASRRPLLVRGEPGTGKSQLARAAAVLLGRSFVPWVVDSRTEARDLHYSVDLVARLAAAQSGASVKLEDFVNPGPLWWAFDWEGARRQALAARAATHTPRAGWTPAQGVVLLIDEIDKADPAVPNGLLDALGHARFHTELGQTVVPRGAPPLIVITTNEERALPTAFLRRCLVLHLRLPALDALEVFLIERGRAHFPAMEPALLRRAGELVRRDRETALATPDQAGRPGVAEYLDLLRAVTELPPQADALAMLDELAEFALVKYGDMQA